MKATEYVDSLIAGINMGSEIPVQLAELDMIKALIEVELKKLAEAIRTQTEYTLVRTENGYKLMKIGPIVAQGEKDD